AVPQSRAVSRPRRLELIPARREDLGWLELLRKPIMGCPARHGPSWVSPRSTHPTGLPPSYLADKVARASPHHREPDQADRANDHPPPGEQVEAVPGHIVEESFHYEPSRDERRNEPNRHHQNIVGAHVGAVFVEVVGESAGHRGHGEVKRKLR